MFPGAEGVSGRIRATKAVSAPGPPSYLVPAMVRKPVPQRRMVLLSGMTGVVLLFAAWAEATRPVKGPHGRMELLFLRGASDLSWVEGSYFATSGRCAGCHGSDQIGRASCRDRG